MTFHTVKLTLCIIIIINTFFYKLLGAENNLPNIEQLQRYEEKKHYLPEYNNESKTKKSPSNIILPKKKEPDNKTSITSSKKIVVKKFIFIGNTIFSDKQLSDISRHYENKEITFGDIQTLRKQLSERYIVNGYINSGAIIPDQTIINNEVKFLIVEGTLSNIEVEMIKQTKPRLWIPLHKNYIKKRLELGSTPPFNANNLKQKFQNLVYNPLIKSANAEIYNTKKLGDAKLLVTVHEKNPYKMNFSFNNNRSPSVGAYRSQIDVGTLNLSGFGDKLEVTTGKSKGLRDISVDYTIPITARDFMLNFKYLKSDANIIEEPFDIIDIESESEILGFGFIQPIINKSTATFKIGMNFEKKKSSTFLFGKGYSFSEGSQNGETKISTISFYQDYIFRSQSCVLAFNSTFKLGIDVLDATINERDSIPDGTFLTWLGQFQIVKRILTNIDFLDHFDIIYRTDVQLSEDALLSTERFSLGGAMSVRGYRENHIVRDIGIISSLEFRFPIIEYVNFAPFFDTGWGKNKNEPEDSDCIYSSGIGLLLNYPYFGLEANIYYGHSFKFIENKGDDLQDNGVHFQINFYY